MADSGGDICAFCCGGCCLVIFSALGSFCNLNTYGANGCGNSNTNAGCCGSCCNDSFDEDKFEQHVKKDLEKTRDPNAVVANEQQLAPTQEMSVQKATPEIQ